MYCDNPNCRVQSFMLAPAPDIRGVQRPIDCPACGEDGITEEQLRAAIEQKMGLKL